MSDYETWIGVFIAIIAVAVFGHYAIWRLRGLPALDEGRLLGNMKGWEIRVVDDTEEGHSVGIAIERHNAEAPNDRYYAILAPAQARELAQWLRLAAAPGRNLEEARLNVNKERGSHGEAIMRDRLDGPK